LLLKKPGRPAAERATMITVDLHTHSIFSLCGMHTVVEMLTRAKELGMDALAITDHGPTLGGRLGSPFFERLHDPVEGIRLLKGVESNLLDEKGAIDFPLRYLRWTDVVLLGIHHNTAGGLGAETYTDMLIAAIERSPFVDIVAHPNDRVYPVDFPRLAAAVKSLGAALELNNAKTLLGLTIRSPKSFSPPAPRSNARLW
jgi:putative hydrolase